MSVSTGKKHWNVQGSQRDYIRVNNAPLDEKEEGKKIYSNHKIFLINLKQYILICPSADCVFKFLMSPYLRQYVLQNHGALLSSVSSSLDVHKWDNNYLKYNFCKVQ